MFYIVYLIDLMLVVFIVIGCVGGELDRLRLELYDLSVCVDFGLFHLNSGEKRVVHISLITMKRNNMKRAPHVPSIIESIISIRALFLFGWGE